MKTLIISSSQNPDSLSKKIAQTVHEQLQQKIDTNVTLLDLSQFKLNFALQPKTVDQEKIAQQVQEADNFIFATPIYNYSISDTLKTFFDTCFTSEENKLFGIIAAAGGEKSYLATQHLMQICIQEWRMIPLPRTIYATKKDFVENHTPTPDLKERIIQFTEDFHTIGNKLLT